MRSTAGLAAVAMLFGTLACAGNTSRGEDETAAAQDTSEAQNPPGYRGMEQDTSQVPADAQATPTDTFLQEQGTGVPEDTAGYGGLEKPDTSGAAAQDTSGAGWADTTRTTGVDTSGMSGMSDTTGQTSWDSTGQQ
jgi:hypothetical protein